MLAWLDYAWIIEMFNVLVWSVKSEQGIYPLPPFLTLLGLRFTLIFMDGPLPHLILPVFFGRDYTVLAMCNYRQCPNLFQDFSVKFTLIVHACVHSIIQHQHVCKR